MPEVDIYLGETELEEIDSMSLARLRLISQNARLVDTRKEHGMTGEDMVAATSISRGHLRDIENLRAIPSDDEMVKIACILEKPIDYLFPEELISAVRVGVFSRRKVELNTPEIISLTEAQRLDLTYDGETAIIDKVSRILLAEQMKDVLTTLTPKEQRVLELRFGLKDGESQTLEAVGREFNVNKERIRQIEAKALRKLRHPRLSRKLQDYLE